MAICRFKPIMSIGSNLFAGGISKWDKTYMDDSELTDLIARNLASLLEEKGLNQAA